MTGAYRVLMEKHEEKNLLGTPTRRWEDNIKMEVKDVGRDDLDCILEASRGWKKVPRFCEHSTELYVP
jgi:hypothetical protein